MSAELDLIQAARDMDFHGADYYSGGFKEALERARKAARELFPPSAKPLEWNPWGEDIFSNVILGRTYSISPEDGAFCVEFGGSKGKKIGAAFATIDEAKAFCESHHQSRFKELLV